MATVFHNPVSFTRCLYVNYTNETLKNLNWCRLQESNPQPTDYKSVALPIVLSRHGLNERIWTFDRLIPNQELSQTELHPENGWDAWIRTKEMPDSESGALPLGYIPIMADSEGLEPSTKRLTAVCSPHWAMSPWKWNPHFAHCVQLCLL